jgi:protocatechuate 3,4-dioxygenase beta subunit
MDGGRIDVLARAGIVRSDITRSFGSSTAQAPGIPLTLSLEVFDAAGCRPLIGYAVYVWHCDRDGDYSLYAPRIKGENYLRGVQLADANGQVTFASIFPACYSGRYPHIHVELYAPPTAETGFGHPILTTQLAMPRSTCEAAYRAAPGYERSARELSSIRTASDMVFRGSSAAQLAAQTPSVSGGPESGYTAVARIAAAVKS